MKKYSTTRGRAATGRAASIRTVVRRTIVIAASALATTAISAGPASAATPTQAIPAAGDVVTCDNIGDLTATGGYLRQRETTTIDGRGRAHVLFTIATDHVNLVDADGAHYQLIGGGFDEVLYPGTEVTGDVVHENEMFYFNVVTGHHIVGVVRFLLHTQADQIPHVHDASTCQLPGMS